MLNPAPDASPQLDRNHHFHRHGVAGIVLIATGIFAFIAIFTSADLLGLLFVPALGVVFLAWGMVSRHARPLVPGGILLGIGVGVLIANLFSDKTIHTGIILLCMALGFIIITPLSRMYTIKTERWPLIPGLILLALSIFFFVSGVVRATINLLLDLWPLALILVGLYLLWEWNRQSKKPQ